MKTKVMTAQEALALIRDGDTLAISSAGAVGYPDYLIKCLEEQYLATQHPSGLTLYAGCGHGMPNRPEGGDNRFGHPGFLKRFVGSHPDVVPFMRKFIEDNEIEGYVLPQGVLNQLYRCSAAKQPGLLTKIGIGTYIDPRQDGGKLNSRTTEDLVSLMEIDGEEYLFYRSKPINAVIFRATTADEFGNVTIEEEALRLENLEMALAASASKGKVIVQVKRIVAGGTLKAKDVAVPAELVSAVVLCPEPETYHMQTAGTYYSPFLSGEMKAPKPPVDAAVKPLRPENIVTRRAAFELFPGAIINIGKGIGDGVGNVALHEGLSEQMTFTIELGPVGGTPMPKLDFSTSRNATAYLPHPSMFDFYHGGGLDITFLGAAQIDEKGNVNVSKYGGRAAGQGGFIDISQTAKKIVFCTYFTAKGFEGEVADGGLRILKDGAIAKFVKTVDQITFNGPLAQERGQQVVICTERCVFRLTAEGLELCEIAPGVDVEKDILAHMDFRPIIKGAPKLMDARIFTPGRMGIFD